MTFNYSSLIPSAIEPGRFLWEVIDDTMWPKFKQGEYAFIEPGRAPMPGDDVLVRMTTGETVLMQLLARDCDLIMTRYGDRQILRVKPHDVDWMLFVLTVFPARCIAPHVLVH
jgi:hypothetical protein